MELELFKNLGQIAGIAGIALGVFFLLFREVIRKRVFANLTKKQSFRLMLTVLILTWSVAVVGVVTWAWLSLGTKPPPAARSHIREGTRIRDNLLVDFLGKLGQAVEEHDWDLVLTLYGEDNFRQQLDNLRQPEFSNMERALPIEEALVYPPFRARYIEEGFMMFQQPPLPAVAGDQTSFKQLNSITRVEFHSVEDGQTLEVHGTIGLSDGSEREIGMMMRRLSTGRYEVTPPFG